MKRRTIIIGLIVLAVIIVFVWLMRRRATMNDSRPTVGDVSPFIFGELTPSLINGTNNIQPIPFPSLPEDDHPTPIGTPHITDPYSPVPNAPPPVVITQPPPKPKPPTTKPPVVVKPPKPKPPVPVTPPTPTKPTVIMPPSWAQAGSVLYSMTTGVPYWHRGDGTFANAQGVVGNTADLTGHVPYGATPAAWISATGAIVDPRSVGLP